MGDVTMVANGLLPKIISSFNNPVYSDVQFDFVNEDGESETIYCHKLILALQSEFFANLFFEKETSLSVMKMQASKKELFYNLFKFLYTGDVNIHTFVEAQNLCELARDCSVEELVKKCHSFMLQDRLTIENIFTKYEQALKQPFNALLKDCRNFVCSSVQLILKSNEFTKASPEVVEDIIKLDNLPLTSELEIITAVFNWGLESLKKNEMSCNRENLRKSVDPFLKHLRILSLTSSEFDYLVKQYDILSAYESITLMQKIIMPESSKRPPQNFCHIVSKRCTTISNNKASTEYQLYNSAKSTESDSPKYLKSDNKTSTEYQHYNSAKSSLTESVQSNSPKYLKSDNKISTEYQHYNSAKSNSPKQVQSDSIKNLKSDNKTSTEYQQCNTAKSSSPKSVRSDPPKSSKFDNNNKIGYEVRRYPVKNTTFIQKFQSSPNIRNIDFLDPKFSQNLLRDFLFPLKKGEESFTLSFPKDIKCSVNMKMKRGNLSLHGFELKIKCKSGKKEKLEVYVYWQELSKTYFEKSYNVELQNDAFSVMFPKPMKLQEGSEGSLEISIENLFLDRCCQISKKRYVLNSGLDFESDLRIDSNKKTEEDGEKFLFLINKLIYLPF